MSMTDHWTEFTRFGIALFALLNPFAAIPYVLVAAGGLRMRGVLVMAAACTATMIVILLGMHVAGEALLVTLGTTLPSFQIGGGLIILLSGLSMLRGPVSDVSSEGAPKA